MSELPPPTYEERLERILIAAKYQCTKDKVYWREYSEELLNRVILDFKETRTKVLADYKEVIWNYFNPIVTKENSKGWV